MGASSHIAKFVKSKRITIVMSFFTVLLLGFIAGYKIPLQLFPAGFENPQLWIWIGTELPSPAENENQVVKIIEPYLNTMAHVKQLKATSSAKQVWITVVFEEGTNMSAAFNRLKDQIDRVYSKLPNQTQFPLIYKFNANEWPILYYAFSFPPFFKAKEVFIKDVESSLTNIEGVGKVSFHGTFGRYIKVVLDSEKLRSLKVSPAQVEEKLSALSAQLPLGDLIIDKKKYYIRTVGRFHSLETIRNIQVDRLRSIYLRDLAFINESSERDYRAIRNIDGKRSVTFGVIKEAGANTIRTCHLVESKLKEIIALAGGSISDPASMGLVKIFSQGDLIEDALADIIKTALIGGAVAMVILFFFLRNFLITSLISFSIPFSLLITVFFLYLNGDDLNVISMVGLMLCIGMVVDNSIVVMEAIFRGREANKDKYAAMSQGIKAVSLPVLVSTLTTIIVFVPIMLIKKGSLFSFFMQKLGIPVCIALLASLVISLIYIPTGAVSLPLSRLEKPPFVIWLIGRYQRILFACLRYGKTTFIITLLLLSSLYFPFKRVKNANSMMLGQSQVRLQVNFSKQQSYMQRKSEMGRIENFLLSQKKQFGIRHVQIQMGEFDDQGNITLYPTQINAQSRETRRLFKRRVTESLSERYSQPGVHIGALRQSNTEESEVVKISVVGDSSEGLVQIAEQIKKRLLKVKNVLEVQTDIEQKGNNQMIFQPNLVQMFDLQVDVWRLARYLSFYFQSRQVGYFRANTKEDLPIILQVGGESDQLKNESDLAALEIPGRQGYYPLGLLGSFFPGNAPQQIVRVDGKNSLTLMVTVAEDDLVVLREQIQQAMDGFQFPAGFALDLGQDFAKDQENRSDFVLAVTFSTLFVFLLMGILFESLILPVTIIFTVPMAFVGAYWGLWITNTQISVMGYLGMIILVGIVVNNAIVLLANITSLHLHGYSLYRSVARSCLIRFRPILMTALTTISGLLPMLFLKPGGIGVDYRPLAVTVIGGLMATTFFVLTFIPLQYIFIERSRVRMVRWWHQLVNWIEKKRHCRYGEG